MRYKLGAIVLTILLGTTFMGCRKSVENAEFTLITTDGLRNPLADSKVVIFASSTDRTSSEADTVLMTDDQGSIYYEYPLECYLNVHVTYTGDSVVLFNETEIHLIPGEHIKDSIILW